MSTNSAPVDEYAFLMDDKQFEELTSNLARRQRKIEKHTEFIELNKTSIDRKINDVCALLFTNPKVAKEYQVQHGEIRVHNLKEHHVKQVNSCNIKISYEVGYGADATVYVCEFDSYEGNEGADIIDFPLNFIHRADWIAKLGILKEALAIKSDRLAEEQKQKTAAAQKAKDLENLRNLMEKYKDEI